MANSGGLSCPDSQYRMYTYYAMNDGIPDLYFGGTERFLGAGTDVMDGEIYSGVINDLRAVESPLSVQVVAYDFGGSSPYMTVRVEIFETLDSNANTYLRSGICETPVFYAGEEFHNILRDMPDDIPLTIQNVGETQEVTIPLTIGGSWEPTNLWAFAFVQRDSDRHIYNAGSTYVTPYAMDVSVEGDQQVELAAPHTFGMTTVTHIGFAEDSILDITLDSSLLPAGWDAYFTMDGVDMTSTTVTLGQYEAADLMVTLVPGTEPESGQVVLNVHSQSGTVGDFNIPFAGLVPGADLLVVADDGGAGYAFTYFGPAIGANNKTFAVWERALAPITEAILAPYDVVIWESGNKVTGWDLNDKDVMTAFTDAGGTLLLSGEHLVGEIVGEYGVWAQFLLRARTVNESSSSVVTGVVDDPISNGLVLDLVGGDGAGNYDNPDVVEPINGGGGVQCFSYDADSGAGVWAEHSNTRILSLGFGFESINSAADRNQLMAQALAWLSPTSAVEDRLPSVAVLNQNVPNPFNPQTVISFDLAHKAPVQLAIYDVTGRMIRVLADEVRDEGNHSVIWDGRDNSGGQVASGTYIYRLISGDKIDSRKMTMVR